MGGLELGAYINGADVSGREMILDINIQVPYKDEEFVGRQREEGILEWVKSGMGHSVLVVLAALYKSSRC